MTTDNVNTTAASTAPSRRAVLVGALGGIGALAAGAIGRAAPVRAAGDDGSNIQIGGTYADVQSQTTLGNQANNDNVLWVASNNDLGFGAGTAITGYSATFRGVHGLSPGGTGVRGESTNGDGVLGLSTYGFGVHGSGAEAGVYGASPSIYGVHGYSTSGTGVFGESFSLIGVEGRSSATNKPAILGESWGNATGLQGHSGASGVPAAKARTGVFGYAAQNKDSKGVWGQSAKGRAIQGSVSNAEGYAGYFDGRVFTNKFYEMTEISNPAAPGNNRARLFIRDNGSGKTQLCIRYATGGVRVLDTQP